MNLNDQRRWLELHYSSCLSVFASREHDYAPDGIALLNLLETAVENSHTILDELWSLYKKQETAIRRYKTTHILNSDSFFSRVRDACNYLSLMAFYEANQLELHRAWEAYWRQQPCSCARGKLTTPLLLEEQTTLLNNDEDSCTRCVHLWWLTRHSPAWSSPVLPSTQKAPA